MTLREHSGLFSFPCLVAEERDALELLFQLAGNRSVESITWLWNDKTTWSQLGHPDMLETALCLGWQGTKFSVILIHPVSVLKRSMSWNTDSHLSIPKVFIWCFCVFITGKADQRRAMICLNATRSIPVPDIILESCFLFWVRVV